VIACDGTFFLITARHVFTNQNADPTEIVISFPDSGSTFWPTTACVHLEAAEAFTADNTFGDFALYELEASREINSLMTEHDFLPFPVDANFSIGAPLFAFGFPDVENDLDLENRQHLFTAVAVEGWYAGATGYRGIHVFESPHLSTSQNGMSGGPITYLDNTRIGRHLLAGLIVQGGDRRLRFIEAKMVRSALYYALRACY
jgi:hypothetical protein